MLDRLHFFKLDGNADVISDVFTITWEQLSAYFTDMDDFDPVPFKDGLMMQKLSTDYRSQLTVSIDFKNEPVIGDTDDRQYIPLSKDRYIIKSHRDNKSYLDVYDGTDVQAASIPIERNLVSAYIKGDQLHVLARIDRYDEDHDRISTLYHEVYDQSGVQLISEDITERSGDLKDHYRISRVIPTDSGFYLVQDNEFFKGLEISVCDADWNKLGDLTFPDHTDLEFLGECGLTTAYQYIAEEDDAVYIINRFNIGGFEIVPKPIRLLGDVDGDGSVTIFDATMIQRYLAGIDPAVDFNVAAADADGDGSVTILDATMIRRYLVGLSSNDLIGAPI